MKRCPHCGFDLTSGAVTNALTTWGQEGSPSAGSLVTCPECEGTIDGIATT